MIAFMRTAALTRYLNSLHQALILSSRSLDSAIIEGGPHLLHRPFEIAKQEWRRTSQYQSGPPRAALLTLPISRLSGLLNERDRDGTLDSRTSRSRRIQLSDGQERVLYEEITVDVSPQLTITCPADIHISPGQPEIIRVKIHQAGNDDEARQIVIEAGSEMREAQLEAGQSLDKNEVLVTSSEKVWNRSMLAGKSTEIATKIEIEVPERYTHLNIDSQGGNVSVATVNEASLRVRTGGGDLKLGKVKASKADCGLAGGDCKADLLVAEKVMLSANGIKIGRLMGRDIEISHEQSKGQSVQTAVDITAVYGDARMVVEAGCLDINLGTLSCTPGLAYLKTTEGSIRVNSLDGRAHLLSLAADPQAGIFVHAQDNLQLLIIDSASRVDLGFSPELAKSVVCTVDPAKLSSALPEIIQVQDSEGSVACTVRGELDTGISLDTFIPDDKTADWPRRPSVHVRCQGSLTAFIESWIKSLSRRTQRAKSYHIIDRDH